MPETIALFDDYYLEAATDKPAFDAFFMANSPKVFSATSTFSYQQALSKMENEQLEKLGSNLDNSYRLCFYLKKGEEKIGWFKGEQKDKDSFSMSNTGIFPAHQQQGIYKAMLPKVLNLLQEAGFQRVISYHQATNNTIIIPKLKAGFLITGFEISDEYGLLIKLTYYFNETRRQAIDFRVGRQKMDENLAPFFS
ncbi:hypothetical protein [Adhaeribacter terreus]|uniref:N-acetyltransferase domain-containing protein n=1 Tax=Adhaeribacter terreus TaxID=529703 RepID=A0ABW0E8U0_9BACT